MPFWYFRNYGLAGQRGSTWVETIIGGMSSDQTTRDYFFDTCWYFLIYALTPTINTWLFGTILGVRSVDVSGGPISAIRFDTVFKNVQGRLINNKKVMLTNFSTIFYKWEHYALRPFLTFGFSKVFSTFQNWTFIFVLSKKIKMFCCTQKFSRLFWYFFVHRLGVDTILTRLSAYML